MTFCILANHKWKKIDFLENFLCKINVFTQNVFKFPIYQSNVYTCDGWFLQLLRFRIFTVSSRILNFCIFPVTVMGKSLTNKKYRGTLKRAICKILKDQIYIGRIEEKEHVKTKFIFIWKIWVFVIFDHKFLCWRIGDIWLEYEYLLLLKSSVNHLVGTAHWPWALQPIVIYLYFHFWRYLIDLIKWVDIRKRERVWLWKRSELHKTREEDQQKKRKKLKAV